MRTNHIAGRHRMLGLVLSAAVLLASCMSGITSEGMDRDVPRPDGPSYDLTVEIRGRASQRFTGTVTTWDPVSGTITLGPEERGEPLGLFVLTVGQTESSTIVLIEATFSTTKVRVGTAAELQAELYGAQTPDCGGMEGWAPFSEAVTVAPEWVSGRICFVVAGLEPDDVPPWAAISGTIAAFAP